MSVIDSTKDLMANSRGFESYLSLFTSGSLDFCCQDGIHRHLRVVGDTAHGRPQ